MNESRREFLATSAAAAAGLLTARPLLAVARQVQQPSRAEPVFTPIRRNVGTFTMRGGTVAWLVNRGGTVVVDTQFPPEAAALLEGLRSRGKRDAVELVINTHHHADHTSGNPVFRGVARHVVAHGMADQHMRRAPGPPAPQPAPGAPEPLYPDTTFTHRWTAEVGDERIVARHHGRGHTSGDAVITFERANVVHMGDLMFHRRHPVVDRAAGASLRNWERLLAEVVNAHGRDTLYVFGHAGSTLPVTGGPAELMRFREYLGALLAFVERQVGAGRSRDEVMAMRAPLAGFEEWGAFGAANPREALTAAYEEVTAGV
jgi:glyoxylase-like metal-dependent hydrolase (beta-lactamase superfamily II)